jgi:adenylate kinase
MLILGAPASGKGTLAKQIVEKYALTHISVGDILRDSVSKETELGHKVKDCLANGTLVDDGTVNGIVFARLRDETGDVLLDGFPRTLNQAKALDGFLSDKDHHLGFVVYLDVPFDVLESRVVNRRICSNAACGEIYHATRKKPVIDGVCDRCGSPLIQRQDDTEQAFDARMEVFHTFYVPVLDYYRGKPIFRQVNGLLLPDEVFHAVSNLYEECV